MYADHAPLSCLRIASKAAEGSSMLATPCLLAHRHAWDPQQAIATAALPLQARSLRRKPGRRRKLLLHAHQHSTSAREVQRLLLARGFKPVEAGITLMRGLPGPPWGSRRRLLRTLCWAWGWGLRLGLSQVSTVRMAVCLRVAAPHRRLEQVHRRTIGPYPKDWEVQR